MTRKERLRRCSYHEELDRPGVFSREAFPHGDSSYDRLKSYLHEHAELKSRWKNPIEFQPHTAYISDQRTTDQGRGFRSTVTAVKTPAGDLRSVCQESRDGQHTRDVEYLLKNRKDVEKYLSLPIPDFRCDVKGFFDEVHRMGEAGVVMADLGQLAGYISKLCGSETFALLTCTDRDIIHAMCRRRQQEIISYLEYLLENGVGPYFHLSGEEQVAPLLHSPQDFRDFVVAYEKPIIDKIHESGGCVHIHCHGSIKKIFRDFVDMGTDVLHPFEAPPMGDIDPSEAKELARGRMCLEGNIQIDRMYTATPEEIREEVEKLISIAFDDHSGLIVSPTASPYILDEGENCFPLYKAMIDTVLDWRA